MCGSFTCSKNSLIALNVFYILVAIILISVAGAAKYTAIVTSLSVVSGIIACGTFLLIIALVGLVAASKHDQVMLFCYMIVLFMLFVIQFAVACACLAINEQQQEYVADQGWYFANDNLRGEAQRVYCCCGYEFLHDPTNATIGHPSCLYVKNDRGAPCCPSANVTTCCLNEEECQCGRCKPLLIRAIGDGFSAVGGLGLFFSFTEIIGFFIAYTYRHQIDPRANIQSLLQRN